MMLGEEEALQTPRTPHNSFASGVENDPDQRPPHIPYILMQFVALLFLIGVYFQVQNLTETCPSCLMTYTGILFFSGILIMLYLCFIKLNEVDIVEPLMGIYQTMTVQKHIYFIVFSSGIGVSSYNIYNLVYLQEKYDKYGENKVVLGFAYIILFLGILIQIFFFYNLSRKKVKTNTIFKTIFLFLFIINFIGFTTISARELKIVMLSTWNQKNCTNLTDYSNKQQNTLLDNSDSPLARGIFLALSTQYFLLSAYLMMNFYCQLHQTSQELTQSIEEFSVDKLISSLKTLYGHAQKDTQRVSILKSSSISDVVPFFKIVKIRSGFVIGALMGVIVLTLKIMADAMMKIVTVNKLQAYQLLFIITNTVNQFFIIIYVIIAYKTFHFMTKLKYVIYSKDLETRGDKFFMIVTHCGVIFQTIFGFAALFPENPLNVNTNLYLCYGLDCVLGLINASIQTHFIVYSSDWVVNFEDELNYQRQNKKQRMAQKFQNAAIVCGILNLLTSIIYLYETQQNYFNIPAYMLYCKYMLWKIVSEFFVNPLQIFYRLYSSVCFFKIAVEFSYIIPASIQPSEQIRTI